MRKILFLLVVSTLLFTACSEKREKKIEEIVEEKVEEKLDEYEDDKKNEVENKTAIILEADKENPTKEEMRTVEALLRRRLDYMGYTEASVAVISKEKKGRIMVEIDSDEDVEEIASSLGVIGQIRFTDEEGNELINGGHIKGATAEYGKTSELDDGNYYVQIEFTKEGGKAFYKATSENIGKPIYIMVDDSIISAPTVVEAINDTVCIITGDFTKESAQGLAANIKSGKLPFLMNIVEIAEIK